MKHILKKVTDEYIRTQREIDDAILDKSEKESVASLAYSQRQSEVKKQINRVRNIIQNKQPLDQ